MEAAPIEDAEPAEAQKTTGSTYSPEAKLKRYNLLLAEFMTYFHGLSEQYPADREFSKAELSGIQPYDIVNWMSMKMFGSEEPDFRDPSISGSHHTLAFWRKGLGYFMPAGQEDWDPTAKTGNPSRSQEVRDLISKVKALNEDGTLIPRKQPNNVKREGDDGGGEQKKKKRARKKSNPTTPRVDAPTPLGMSGEFNMLLGHIDAQKAGFLQSLDQLNATVNQMKADVESSYSVLLGRLAHLGSKAVAASDPSGPSGVPAIAPPLAPPLIPRSRTLFTVWSVQNGKLAPVPAEWSFPKALTAKEAIYLWFLGEPSSHTPPLQYVTTGHLKHLKGAAYSHGSVRRFMRVVRYLGLKAGFWCEQWNNARVDALWSKIWPEIELSVADHLEDAEEGSINSLVNALSKHTNVLKEMSDNPEIQSDEYATNVVDATENALGGSAGGVGSEMLWGIHHGKLNPLPSTYEFPSTVDVHPTVLRLWLVGEPDKGIPPLRYVHSAYVTFLKSGTGYLSKLRCIMKVIRHHGTQLDCWHEDSWSDEAISTLWTKVWEVINPKFKHQGPAGGKISWQALYNKMHESGMIKEVREQEDNEAEQDIEDEAGQGTEV